MTDIMDKFHVSSDPKDLAHASEHHSRAYRHRIMLVLAVAAFVVAGVVVYLA